MEIIRNSDAMHVLPLKSIIMITTMIVIISSSTTTAS